jgi:hypothetical protein
LWKALSPWQPRHGVCPQPRHLTGLRGIRHAPPRILALAECELVGRSMCRKSVRKRKRKPRHRGRGLGAEVSGSVESGSMVHQRIPRFRPALIARDGDRADGLVRGFAFAMPAVVGRSDVHRISSAPSCRAWPESVNATAFDAISRHKDTIPFRPYVHHANGSRSA